MQTQPPSEHLSLYDHFHFHNYHHYERSTVRGAKNYRPYEQWVWTHKQHTQPHEQNTNTSCVQPGRVAPCRCSKLIHSIHSAVDKPTCGRPNDLGGLFFSRSCCSIFATRSGLLVSIIPHRVVASRSGTYNKCIVNVCGVSFGRAGRAATQGSICIQFVYAFFQYIVQYVSGQQKVQKIYARAKFQHLHLCDAIMRNAQCSCAHFRLCTLQRLRCEF